ncbi:cytochrome c oxidase assembly protein COX18, mitochondrial [Bufo gargarizans]|uniref:cytochrome c oxidase assembly protein COX18, mitochondrial n=1 Tax=Bufo gargarizans TaxID=30331 RepID=UPI001CF33629|nr:cytochrome c oxidase assembly protein COX18, mitochondrial [Bufo gargarizans]
MFFTNVKTIWTRTAKRHSFQILLSIRCPHAQSFGTSGIKKHQEGLINPVRLLAHSHRRLDVNGRSPLFASYVSLSPRPRTIASAAPLAAASTGQANSDYGIFAKMADSAPVHLAENVLTSIQEVTGLPWWANIMCTTVALRTVVTLPLSIYQMHILGKVEKLQSEIQNLAKELRYEVAVYGKQHGWSDKVAKFHFRKNLKRLITELYVRDNCHPFKASLIMWIQIPLWIFVSLALRNFSFNTSGSNADELVHKQLQNGGALWFPDLTMPDSTWILPVLLGSINLLLVEMFALRTMELSRFQKYLTNIIRGISIIMIPVAASVPSSMALYWVSSSFVGLVHNLFLRSPAVRRLFRIPRTKSDSDNPYKDLLAAFVAKYIQKK